MIEDTPSQSRPSLVNFQPTITLGNAVTFIGWVVFVIIAWTHLRDEQDYLQSELDDMRQTESRMVESLSTLEQLTASQTALIQSLRDRIALDETYMEKH